MQVTLLSTGIDIGTSTMGMVISRLKIKNTAGMFTVPHMSIVDKEVIYKSRIYHTPLLDEYHIDIDRIQQILESEYARANIKPEQIETGAVIITGESAVKENAQAVLQSVSGFAGDFVVATAGPDLESVISGQGAGAQQFSEKNSCTVLNVDIGGGTSNFSLFDCGVLRACSCYDIGGRLIKVDDRQVIYAMSPRLKPILYKLGISLNIGDRLEAQTASRIAAAMADILGQIVEMKNGSEVQAALQTRGSRAMAANSPQYLSLSGGVAELIGKRQDEKFRYGDLGVFLAEAVERSRWYQRFPVIPPKERIRATVVGAGNETTTLSGSTISVFPEHILPLKNLPVLVFSEDEEQIAVDGNGERLAERMAWFLGQTGSDNAVMAFVHTVNPGYQQIRRLAASISHAVQRTLAPEQTIIVLCEHDFAKSLGQCLKRAEPGRSYVAIDSVIVRQGDYLDIGRPILNGLAVPVIVKTLITG